MNYRPAQPRSLTPADLEQILIEQEGPNLEFKLMYDLSKGPELERRRGECAKDILALANTTGRNIDDFAYMVIGAGDKQKADGTRASQSIEHDQYTNEIFLKCVNGHCRPELKDLLFQEIPLNGTLYGVIIVPPSPHVHCFSKDTPTVSGRIFHKNIVPVRIGEEVVAAPIEEWGTMQAQKSAWAAPMRSPKINVSSPDGESAPRLRILERVERADFIAKYWRSVSWHLSAIEGFDTAGNRVVLRYPNETLKEYTQKYEHFLAKLWDWADSHGWPAELKLVAANVGTAPASNVRIKLVFPDGVSLVDPSAAEKLPLPPEPPSQMTIPEPSRIFGDYIPQIPRVERETKSDIELQISEKQVAQYTLGRIAHHDSEPLRGLLVRTVPLPAHESHESSKEQLTALIDMRDGRIEMPDVANGDGIPDLANGDPVDSKFEVKVTILFDELANPQTSVFEVVKEAVKFDIGRPEKGDVNSARHIAAEALAAVIPGLKEHLEKRESEKLALLKAQSAADADAVRKAHDTQVGMKLNRPTRSSE